MAGCEHGEEGVVIRVLPDFSHHQVEDGQGQPADEEDGHHAYQEPASSEEYEIGCGSYLKRNATPPLHFENI